MKILIRVVDDWGEIYVDGEFVFDGLWSTHNIILDFVQALRDVTDIEVRFFEGNSVVQLSKSGKVEAYSTPLHVMTGKNYWYNWDVAEIVPMVKKDDDES